MRSCPIYILRLGEEWRIVFPEGKTDMGHTEFWEETVAGIVADHFKIARRDIVNLPYCQRRARIVGKRVFYGERATNELLRMIEKATGESGLVFVEDDHEKRLQADAKAFEAMLP